MAAAPRSGAGSTTQWFRELAMKMWRTRLAPLVKLSFYAMGTEVSVTVSTPGHRSRRDDAVQAIADVEKLMQDFGRHWWAWGNGELAQINRQLAAGEVARIPGGMRALFARAWAVRQATGGLFEPRVASLVRLWGFHDMAALHEGLPPRAEVERLLEAMHSAPAYDGGASYGPAPGVGWDFGGIGKGWIVDAALDLLRDRGFPDAIVDAGGNLAVRGGRGDRPWRIGIRDPRSSQDAEGEAPRLIASLMARDEAVNTHGDDQRFFEVDGQRYSHILDPRTGMPAQGLRSLTVVHPDGTLAEAGGAALYVAGRDKWPVLARKLGLSQVLALTDAGEVQVTSVLAGRLQPASDVRLQIVS